MICSCHVFKMTSSERVILQYMASPQCFFRLSYSWLEKLKYSWVNVQCVHACGYLKPMILPFPLEGVGTQTALRRHPACWRCLQNLSTKCTAAVHLANVKLSSGSVTRAANIQYTVWARGIRIWHLTVCDISDFFVFSFAGIRVLVDAREKLHIPWGDPANQLHGETVMSFDTRSVQMAQGMVETKVFLQFLPSIRSLWSDSGIQNAYDRRREFQLVSCRPLHLKFINNKLPWNILALSDKPAEN